MPLDDYRAERAEKLRLAIGALEEALRISYEYLRELEGLEHGVKLDGSGCFMLGPKQPPGWGDRGANTSRC